MDKRVLGYLDKTKTSEPAPAPTTNPAPKSTPKDDSPSPIPTKSEPKAAAVPETPNQTPASSPSAGPVKAENEKAAAGGFGGKTCLKSVLATLKTGSVLDLMVEPNPKRAKEYFATAGTDDHLQYVLGDLQEAWAATTKPALKDVAEGDAVVYVKEEDEFFSRGFVVERAGKEHKKSWVLNDVKYCAEKWFIAAIFTFPSYMKIW